MNKTNFKNPMHYDNSGTLTIIFQYLQNTEGGVIIVSQELRYVISLKTNVSFALIL